MYHQSLCKTIVIRGCVVQTVPMDNVEREKPTRRSITVLDCPKIAIVSAYRKRWLKYSSTFHWWTFRRGFEPFVSSWRTRRGTSEFSLSSNTILTSPFNWPWTFVFHPIVHYYFICFFHTSRLKFRLSFD